MERSHISSEELLAFLCDGEALHPAARQHLDCCLVCQQQMRSYQQVARALTSQLYRCFCPSAATLSTYCLPGGLTNTEQRQVAEHLARCPRCASELMEARQFLEISL